MQALVTTKGKLENIYNSNIEKRTSRVLGSIFPHAHHYCDRTTNKKKQVSREVRSALKKQFKAEKLSCRQSMPQNRQFYLKKSGHGQVVVAVLVVVSIPNINNKLL